MTLCSHPEQAFDKNESPAPTPYQAGDLILDYLRALGVEYVFGIPGGAIEPLYNALVRAQRSGGPRAIVARHEAGAAFMADGYARESGKLGVCCATSGPGATNTITGVASAYQDEIPLLVITGQPPLDQFGSNAVQESSCTGIDTVAMFKHCTVYSSLVSHPQQLERKLVAAITAAYQHRRPVHLSIPLNILRHEQRRLQNRDMLPPILDRNQSFDRDAAKLLSQRLHTASRPVVVIGEGSKEATRSIVRYCEYRGISMVTTPQAKGLVNPYHTNFHGVCGVCGHESAMHLLNSKDVDLIVIVGSSLEQYAVCGWKPNDPGSRKVVHIDSNMEHFSRSQFATLHIYGNIQRVFDFLIEDIKTRTTAKVKYDDAALNGRHTIIPFERRGGERRTETLPKPNERRKGERRCLASFQPPLVRNFKLLDERKYLSQQSLLKPQRLMYELSLRAPENTRFLADIGNSFLWAIHYLNPHSQAVTGSNYNYLQMGLGFSSMAWSIGAAIGVKLAKPQNVVICIVGDGSLLMSGHELTVAVQLGLPVIYIVLNDQVYGTCKHGQMLSGAESIGTELPAVDFAMYAQAIGAHGVTIRSLDDFQQVDFISLNKKHMPSLIDVHIDTTEAPPLSERLSMLASGVESNTNND